MIAPYSKQNAYKLALALALCTATTALSAKSRIVAVYTVTGLKPGSALNVRAQDNSKSTDIGSASLGLPVEVVGYNADKTWAKIKWEKSFGWVSMKFLDTHTSGNGQSQIAAKPAKKAPAVETTASAPKKLEPTVTAAEPETTLPNIPVEAALIQTPAERPSVICKGNGPNWSLTLNRAGAMVFQAPDETSVYATTQWQRAVDNDKTYAFEVVDIKGMLVRTACMDKRTNTQQHWQLQLQTNGVGGQSQLNGCCEDQ